MNGNSMTSALIRLHGSAAIAALAISSMPAQAQVVADEVSAEPPAASETEDRDENTIVVTARRTEERLQDVPVAVAAFGSEALEE